MVVLKVVGLVVPLAVGTVALLAGSVLVLIYILYINNIGIGAEGDENLGNIGGF